MRRLTLPLLTLAALLLAACAGAPPKAPPAPEGAVVPPPAEIVSPAVPAGASFTALVNRMTEQAEKQERAGDLARALDSWKVVAALRPGEAAPGRRVADLTARIATEAERRYRAGLAKLQEGNVEAARRELLLALVVEPDHPGALDALKNRLGPETLAYTVAAGDSFESIAKKHYGDGSKAVIVARVNDLDPASAPAPGTVLSLPYLAPPAKPAAAKRGAPAVESEDAYDTEPAALSPEPAPPAAVPAPAAAEPVQAADPAEAQLATAAGLLKAGRNEEAAAAAEQLASHPAVGKQARELAGNAWFAVGDAALKANKFPEAEAAYKKAEPTRKDAAAALAAVGRRKKEKAEEFYKAGVSAFINEKLDEAVRNWEQTLALNPEHPKAPKDIEKARALQQKLKDLR